MDGERWIGRALTSLALLCTTSAQAHFVLLQPTSWLNEDDLGGPQKGSPCGPGNTRPFIGDDVQPIPVSDAVTTFRAGETITVELQETVYHPGYFRISLARVPAADATSTDFPDPPLTDLENCHYDRAAVQTVAHDNVLADGLFMSDVPDGMGSNRGLTQEVELPDEPCDRCTLQVVQVMEGHPASSCFYFHCAEIQIVPAEGGRAGASGGAGAGASPRSDDGCSVADTGARSSPAAAWCLLGVATVVCWRRRAHLLCSSRALE